VENRGDETDETGTAARLARAEKALRQSGRELKWWQIELEHTTEDLQRARRQRARLREQADILSEALAEALAEAYWSSRQSPSGVGRLLGRGPSTDPESDLVREVEGSDLFDGPWYLRTHPKAARSGLSPALHYVRHAARLDPGPRFHTRRYLEQHPEAAAGDLPPLLHALRHGHLTDRADDADNASSPAHDAHL
jgi:hypothetical protein